MKKSLLIIKPGALGDTILTFDLLANLKEHNYEVTFCGNSSYISLISYFGLGNVYSIEHSYFLPLFYEQKDFNLNSIKVEQLKNFLSKFSYIVLIYHTKNELYHRLKLLFPNQLIYVPSIPMHKISIRCYLSKTILECLNLPIKYINFSLSFPKYTCYKKIIIHPGSGSKYKIWKMENYLSIVEYLLKKNKEITIIEGPAEYNISKTFERKFHHQINYIKVFSPFEFIQQINQHHFYIGNDSGLTHLASFLGIPGIAIFGKTDPWLWNPIPCIKCLYKNTKDGIFFPSLEFVLSYLKFIQL